MPQHLLAPIHSSAREPPASPPLVVPLLVILTLVTFAGVLWCGFVNYDDPSYVTDNPTVRQGLTLHTVAWAFTHRFQDVYGPLPPISFALDVQMFGLQPAGFHLENLLLHCANVALLYALLRRLTGSTWRSALTCALWAIHPCRVESVAWVSERKDMLMALFGLSSLRIYVEYVDNPLVKRYLLMSALLVLSLLAKPTLIVMPALLLLLDFWPLGRTALWKSSTPRESVRWRRLIIEKLPLAAICILFVAIFVSGPKGIKAPPNAAGPLSFAHQMHGVLRAYAQYVIMTFDFRGRAVAFPIPVSWPLWQIAGSGCFLISITLAVLWNRHCRPWLVMGWSWFGVMLAPVIGILFPTDFAWVDHFTYLSSIGLLIAIVWSLPSSLGQSQGRRILVGMVTAIILISMSIATAQNVQYWQDSTTLWRHVLEVTHDNWLAECNYGIALDADGQPDAALPHFLAATKLNPGSAQAHYNYGGALQRRDNLPEAVAEFRKAVKLNPRYSQATLAAGTILMNSNQFAAAADIFGMAAPYDFQFVAPAHCSRGADLLQHDRPHEAIGEFQQALAAQSDYLLARMGLGVALLKTGQATAAVAQFEEADKLNPNDPAIQKNLRAALEAQSSPTTARSAANSATQPVR